VRVTPQGIVTVFALDHPHSNMLGLTAGPDGELWYSSGDYVGKFAPPR